MATKLDLHLHTPGSDGTGKPEDFVRAIKAAGLDGVVITDHHRTLTQQGLDVAKAVRAAGLVCLVACEYSSKEGHILVFGIDVRKLGLGWYPTMQQVIDRTREMGGVAFPSHPFRGVKETLGARIYQLQNLTHAEAFNGQNEAGNGWASTARPEANQLAVKAAVAMGLGMTGGSDAHVPERIGTCFTEFGGTIRTTKDLLDALRAKDHRACVNTGMVEEQRKAATTREAAWRASHPDVMKERWRESNDRWWDGDDLEPRPIPGGMWLPKSARRLDRSSGASYPQVQTYGDDQEDAPGLGLSDDDIPPWAFSDEDRGTSNFDHEDPEAIQAFLVEQFEREEAERAAGKTKAARGSKRRPSGSGKAKPRKRR